MGIVKQGISEAEKNTTAEITAGVAASKAVAFGGSGADGAKTVASSENLTPDTWYEYTTLTINSGQTLGLNADGRMLLLCTEKVTINGTISVNARGCSGGAGGTPGGVGGAENNGGLCSGGGGGGGGGIAGGSVGGNGGKVDNNEDILYGLGDLGKLILNVAGGGGGGGNGNAQAGGAGGGSADAGCGAGGTGGNAATIGTAHAGGAGGCSGGNILIISPEVEIVSGGVITAVGTVGSNSGDTNGGGGGGGGGGKVLIITKKYTSAGTITVNGAAGGMGRNNGGNGGNGAYIVKLV